MRRRRGDGLQRFDIVGESRGDAGNRRAVRAGPDFPLRVCRNRLDCRSCRFAAERRADFGGRAAARPRAVAKTCRDEQCGDPACGDECRLDSQRRLLSPSRDLRKPRGEHQVPPPVAVAPIWSTILPLRQGGRRADGSGRDRMIRLSCRRAAALRLPYHCDHASLARSEASLAISIFETSSARRIRCSH